MLPRRLLVCFGAVVVALTACSGSGTTVGGSGSQPGTAASPGASPTPTAKGSTPVPGASGTPNSQATATPNPAATVPFAATPDSDSFYAQPRPFPSSPAGTILTYRAVTYAPSGGTTLPNKAYEVKFVSRDTNGHPIAAVATVALPLTPVSSTTPLLLDALAEDGLGAQCAPSHDVTGSTVDSNEQLEANEAEYGLNQGWVVVYPDHEGPQSAYASPSLAGYISLDSIRAALHFAPAGLGASAPVGLYGYSGGAIAVAWAATLEKSYAPELHIVGVASGGTPANPKSITQNIDTNTVSNAAFFSLILSAVYGTNRSYPTLLGSTLNAKGIAAGKALANGCLGATTDGSPMPTGTLSDYTIESDPVDAPSAEAIYPLITLALPGSPPVANMFVFHSQVDELIPIAGVDAMVSAWCAAGSTVNYYRGASGDHIGFEATVSPLAFAYLASRFNATATVTPPDTTTCN